jgi:hypothetical protein
VNEASSNLLKTSSTPFVGCANIGFNGTPKKFDSSLENAWLDFGSRHDPY